MGLLWEGRCHLSARRKVTGGPDIPLDGTMTIGNSRSEDKPAAETAKSRKND
jgi:hypothetical protein